MTKARLQGGPFDGDRAVIDVDPPDMIWTVADPVHFAHWFDYPVPKSEIYHRDHVKGGWLVYVYRDRVLGGPLGYDETRIGTPTRIDTRERERELTPA